jgi:hypothetical protein
MKKLSVLLALMFVLSCGVGVFAQRLPRNAGKQRQRQFNQTHTRRHTGRRPRHRKTHRH